MTLKLVPINLKEANALVSDKHRHNGPLRQGALFNIGLVDAAAPAKLIGAITVGSIVASGLTVPWGCEVRRLVTDGTKNACSMLYGAAWRAAQAMGFEGMITYTLTPAGGEEGKSLRAANWRLDDDDVPVRIWVSRDPKYKHLPWSQRPQTGNSPALPRYRWFIGRRIPTQSKIRYPDDPEGMGTNPRLNANAHLITSTAPAVCLNADLVQKKGREVTSPEMLVQPERSATSSTETDYEGTHVD